MILDQLKEMIATLEAEDKQGPPKPPRTISVMSKSVQYGDHVNFEGYGWKEVNGHIHYADSGDTVLATMGTGGAVHTFPGNQRVQVRRYA